MELLAIDYPTVVVCMNGITVLDTRMVAGIPPSPVSVWIGAVLLWILAGLCLLVDAKSMLEYSLEEEVPPGTLIGDILNDSNIKRTHSTKVVKELYFVFLTEPNWNIAIESSTGILRTNGRMDRESFPHCVNKKRCELTVDIAVQPINYFQIIKVAIQIDDINDNAPEFVEPEITHPILESAEPGNSFVIPTATDLDSPVFGVVRYELESHRGTFSINVNEKLDGSLDVQLTIDRRLDRERRHRYKVKVVAFDGGQPAKEGRLNIAIPILDSNDNIPVFDQPIYNINIPENLALGTSILKVHATDPDLGQNGKIQYSFSIQTQSLYGNTLNINSDTGEIFVKGEVDREQVPVYNLVVTARDSGPNAMPSDATVILTILDANDNAPQIRISTLGSTRPDVALVPEDSSVGTFVAQVLVSDPDEGPSGMLNCSLNDYTFSLQPKYESEYQIETSRVLDRESIPQYGLEVICRDRGQPSQHSVRRLTVEILDVNDNAPEFSQKSYATTITENNDVNAGILATYARDPDKGINGQVRYSLQDSVSDVFEIDRENGGIKAIDSLDREKMQKYEFRAIATDLGNPPQSSYALIVITVNDENDKDPTFVVPTFTFRVDETEHVGVEIGEVTAIDDDVYPNNQFFYSFEDEETVRSFYLNSKTGIITSQKSLDRERQAEYDLVVKATDRTIAASSSKANVKIIILDLNDNPPRFIFPNPRNHTIRISNQVPKHSRIAKVTARDPDEGENARLNFTVHNGYDLLNYFTLDRHSGDIMTKTYLSDIPNARYEFTIVISDNGKPRFTAQQDLLIVVDNRIPYPPPKPEVNSPLRSKNFHYNVIVVVAVACGATVIVISCIICIILVRKNKQRRDSSCSGKPNGPTESHRMLGAKDSQGSNDDHIAMKDIDAMDISESMRKLLVANNREWDKGPPDQGDVGLEITKVLSEMDDEAADLPELLSHTQGCSPIPYENEGGGGGPLHVAPPLPTVLPHEDREEGDSDTTAELNAVMTAAQGLLTGSELPGNKPSSSCPKPQKGKISFTCEDQQSSPRTKVYQYPPPPPPPPNRLRTFCPDGKLPESPQRSCLIQDKDLTLPKRGPKVVTWQPSPDQSSQNSNYENGNFDPYDNDMDPWEQRRPTKTESMIV